MPQCPIADDATTRPWLRKSLSGTLVVDLHYVIFSFFTFVYCSVQKLLVCIYVYVLNVFTLNMKF